EDHGKEIVEKLFEIIDQLVEQADGFLQAGAIQNAKNWGKLLQLQLQLLSDIPDQIKTKKE
ncbi:MAG: hypothetical protein ACTSVP_07285, partial [Candidatus Heimdallarchaeota archaeon]